MITIKYCLAFLFVVFAITVAIITKSILVLGIIVIYLRSNSQLAKKTPVIAQVEILRS